jgi:hypothetical protein
LLVLRVFSRDASTRTLLDELQRSTDWPHVESLLRAEGADPGCLMRLSIGNEPPIAGTVHQAFAGHIAADLRLIRRWARISTGDSEAGGNQATSVGSQRELNVVTGRVNKILCQPKVPLRRGQRTMSQAVLNLFHPRLTRPRKPGERPSQIVRRNRQTQA